MGDGDSISSQVGDQLKDLGTRDVKDSLDIAKPKNILKQVTEQVFGNGQKKEEQKTPEEQAQQKKDEISAAQRIQAIDEEIKRIAAEREKLTGPEIPNTNNTNEDLMTQQSNPQQKQNLQITLAQTKGETGRGAKG